MTDRPQSRVMSFWEHLGELRVRLVRVAVTMVAAFILSWAYREQIFAVINEPIRAALARHDIFRLIAIDAAEAILVYLKMSVAAAVMLSAPVFLAQVWGFVKPGLYPHERRPVRRVVILSILMFFIGVLFCYRLILPLVIDFLTAFTVGGEGIDFQLTMQSAFSTALLLMMMFGLVFLLPLVMVLLAATGIITWRHFVKYTKYFAVGSFILGAMLTPPDVISQVLMAVPLLVLYGIGIGLSFLIEVGRRRRDRGDGPATEPSGPDWILALGVLALGGIVALLVWPVGPGMAELVPPDPDRALTWDRERLPDGKGGLAGLEVWARHGVDPAGAERLMAVRYDQGELILLTGDAADGCSGGDFPGTWDGGGPCYRAGDVVALGPLALLAQVRHRHQQGEPGPAPVFPSGRDPPVALFQRTEGQGQPEGVETGVFEDGRISVLLTMRDGGEARAMSWSLEAALDQAGEVGASGGADAETDPMQEVAALLLLLSRDEAPAIRGRAEALAVKLAAPGDTPGGFALVDRLVAALGSPDEIEADGRNVIVRFAPREDALAVLALWP